MRFFKSKTHPIVQEKAQEAEELKAAMINESDDAMREVQKLNKLIKSNGFALKIIVGMGGRHK